MPVTRRRFIQGSLVAAGSIALPLSMPSRVLGANDQVRLAVIGLSRGETLVDWIMDAATRDQSIKLVAVGDVDSARLEQQAGAFERKYTDRGLKLERYQDFRKLLDNKDIDAVCVATPNH